uniref:Guanylate cyclase n=1 Tax=Stomoxys calcitrans TaxID=35570 RepID=A0A1I8PTX7_STOCA
MPAMSSLLMQSMSATLRGNSNKVTCKAIVFNQRRSQIITNVQVKVSGNQSETPNNRRGDSSTIPLAAVVDNNVERMHSKSTTASATTMFEMSIPVLSAATSAKLSGTAGHVTDLMRRQHNENGGNDFVPAQKHKRNNKLQPGTGVGADRDLQSQTPSSSTSPSRSPSSEASGFSSRYYRHQPTMVRPQPNGIALPPNQQQTPMTPGHKLPPIATATTKDYERVAILMPPQLLHRMHVQQGFYDFVEFFQVNLNNVNVDFIGDDDLTTFIKLLEQPNYTTVVKTLNTGINLDYDDDDDDDDNGDDDLHEGVSPKPQQPLNRHGETAAAHSKANGSEPKGKGPAKTANGNKKDASANENDGDGDADVDDNVRKGYEDLSNGKKEQSQPRRMKQGQKSLNIGYCHLAQALQRDFNKTVLLWPCPHMKESSNFLPSYEAISFAVKSIATKLNWTQVDIFVGDENWALPMAIAANMHIPYKIEIGEDDIRDLHAEDKFGKAIIITAAMNDDSTLRVLSLLESLQHTKVLLIDIVATSFNAENRFYKYLTRINPDSALMSNLLLLTVLSDNYRHFLNVAFDDNGIELVQNFRQKRHRKEVQPPPPPPASLTHVREEEKNDWPIHLDKSMAEVLHVRPETAAETEMATENHTQTAAAASASVANVIHNKLESLSEWLTDCPFVNESRRDLNEICLNYQPCLDREGARNESIASQLLDLCQTHFMDYEQHLIDRLRSFIDFFNFYDFLIANILPTNIKASHSLGGEASAKPLINESGQVPKYDFIVLDVVRKRPLTSATSASSHAAETTGSNSTGSQQSLNSNNATTTTITGGHDKNIRMYLESLTPSLSANAGRASMPDEGLAAAFKWRPLLILEQHEIHLKTYITHSIRPGYDDWLVSTAQLWQCGSICWTIIAISASLLVAIIVASVAAGIAMRNYFLRKRLSKGPNKIVLSANDFVFPVDSRRVDEGIEAMLCCWLQQLQEFGGPEVDKPDLLKGSIGSLKNLGFLIPGASGPTTINGLNGKTGSGSASLARHNPALLDMRARYNGDLVQLKEVSLNGSTELKSKAMDLLVMAHGLRHENINPLIGWLADPNRTAMVFDYCSRGSLQDVLIMDEIKLDWSFRLSLLTDLVRGMRYLHASPLRVHGTLTSRNCVVDARWVLKITDYGLPQFYEAQGVQPTPRTAKEMLWCAPEQLRSLKPHQHHNHSRLMTTQAGDVYSFGIIMQEVVVRGEPYCMLSLSAEEIIAKIKKPPPLIRPSVSKGAAPPEAINIMRQCWAEQPEMRPDFNSVYERFKLLNHGRKVNFVDTMFQMLEKYSNNLEELIRERTDQLDMERKKTEQLLNRMLPNSVAEKLKMGLAVEPEEFSDVTIYFSDIVGFTTIAAHCTPVQVVDLLNDLYTIFDATINAYNVYKVETIGDAYMVVSGLPVRVPDHAEQIATMALDLLHQSGRFNVKHLPGVPLQLRIGLHTGPCCAGVVGLTMPRYCLFGDTVNTASRMESTGSSWRIHMSQETRNRLEARGGYTIEPRGLIDIKGKGMMNTFWLLGKKGFDKPLPNPPPIGESHGLDESLIRNSITLKAQANKSRTSTNPSSSQSSSLAGESVEVKVEITPPTNAEISSPNLPNSYSLDSNSTTTISPNMTLCPEFPIKTPSTSPQSRKISELPGDNLLNPNSFNRLPSSTAGSSSRLYKKIEEMMDLSSPYNHYKCLSPSESNLTQFYDGKYLYSGGGVAPVITSTSGNCNSLQTARFEKPGSSRLLRRQFSLDRDDTHAKGEHHHQQHHQSSLQSSHTMSMSNKSSMLEIPILHDTARSPKGTINRLHKQNSNSIAQDLEKIEEIPLSPASSQQHSSLDSNMNRSPPSTVDAQSPPPPTALRGVLGGYLPSTSPPPATLLSAPASPAPSRSLNGGLASTAIMESPTTDASSTATTTASVNSNQTVPSEDHRNLRKPEITLNVEALLSR